MACLWANVAVPGSGSWRAGRRTVGAWQFTLLILGVVLKAAWFAWFMAEWSRLGRFPVFVMQEHPGELLPGFLPWLLVALTGVGLFVLAWSGRCSPACWSCAKRNKQD